MYLDLAVEGAVRSAVEASLGAISPGKTDEEQEEQTGLLIDLIVLSAENVCLSVGSNTELLFTVKDYQVCLHSISLSTHAR